jgi:hypothetical protein
MADTAPHDEVTQITTGAAVTGDEVFHVIDDPSGTPASAGMTPTAIKEFTDTGIRRAVQIIAFDFTTDVAVGDGAFYFHIDSSLAGTNLIDVHAEVITAGTTGTTDIQIHNVTSAADILSTKLTIDSTETGSDTAAVPAVINAAEDDMTENDLIRIDIDAVSTTAPKGLIVTMGFQIP